MTESATTMISYEYPLHERVRTYLRLEHLFQQMRPQQTVTSEDYMGYFNTLFAILDLCERSDIRTDLLKDLERRKTQLQFWAAHPDVSSPALEATRNQLEQSYLALTRASRIGSALKQTRFLASIRQRFAMPGGTCNFDLPQLHYWLAQPPASRQQAQALWWSELAELAQALALELHMLREQVPFTGAIAALGLFQENTEALALLRLQIPAAVPAYPVVSGHKQRYSIRFMRSEPEQGRASFEHDVEFLIARCPLCQ